HYQLKELLESTFIDNAGRLVYRLERFKRDSSHHEWQIADVWMVTNTDLRLEKTEENVRILKLIFPVKEGESWDGNAYNNEQEVDYEYASVNEALSLGNFTFMETATVIQKDFKGGPFFHEDVRE